MSEGARVEAFELILKSLRTPVGLELAAVRLSGDELSFQTDPFAYHVSKPAQFEALILESTLEGFVRSKLPDNMDLASLKLEPGHIVVKATVRVLLPVTATATCTLRIEDGKKLFVELQAVEMLGAGVKSLVQKQIDAINPILDVDTWPVDIRLAEVAIEAGRITAAGTLQPKSG